MSEGTSWVTQSQLPFSPSRHYLYPLPSVMENLGDIIEEL